MMHKECESDISVYYTMNMDRADMRRSWYTLLLVHYLFILPEISSFPSCSLPSSQERSLDK